MKDFLKFMVPYAKLYRKHLIFSALFVVLAVVSQLIVPLYLQFIIDNFGSNTKIDEVTLAFFILVGLALLELIGNFGARIFTVFFSRKAMESIRHDIFHKLHEQELEFYSRETVGQILARTIEEVYSLQEILTWGWRIAVQLVLLSIGTFLIMFIQAPILAGIYSLIFPITIFILIRSSNKNAKIFYDLRLTIHDSSCT